MSRPIVVGDLVIVRPECLDAERAASFDGPPHGRVERIDRECPEEGALARLDGEADDGSGGRSSGRWVSLAALERVALVPAVTLPDDPKRLARALALLDACEAIDARMSERSGGRLPARFDHEAIGTWDGEADGISARMGTLDALLIAIGGSLRAEALAWGGR